MARSETPIVEISDINAWALIFNGKIETDAKGRRMNASKAKGLRC